MDTTAERRDRVKACELQRRETIATAILGGMMTLRMSYVNEILKKKVAEAVRAADLLIEELNKQGTEP